MGVKLTAVTVGVCMGLICLFSGLSQLTEDGMDFRDWLSLILFSAAVAALTGLLYVPLNRFLHKHGWSLHDDEDFEE